MLKLRTHFKTKMSTEITTHYTVQKKLPDIKFYLFPDM